MPGAHRERSRYEPKSFAISVNRPSGVSKVPTDLLGYYRGIGEVVGIFEKIVLEPEEAGARLVALVNNLNITPDPLPALLIIKI
jgi:hypothetical protein